MSHPAAIQQSAPATSASAAGRAEPDPMVGRVIAGRFTVLSRLGEGAMGTVYRAKQSPIGREVAVKILRSDRALDETSRARFLREARANSLLTSPNTVTVFDFGADTGGEFYLAMELLEGESLGQRLKRMGRLSPAAALDMARQALRSLAEAHAKGIIHRDLKPDNLFFARHRTNETYEEAVKVLDFGIAKMLRADDELAMNAIETQAGTVFGTPRYMSPEQAQGKVLDARSDLYSLGVILYQVLTGRAPFTDDDAIVVMARHIKTTPRPIREVAPEANVPPEIESAVMRVLSKEPGNRPQTAEAMSAELGAALESALSATSGVRASMPPAALSPKVDATSTVLEPAPVGVGNVSRRWPFPLALAVLSLAAVGLVGVAARSHHVPSADRGSAAAAAPRMAGPVATAPPPEPALPPPIPSDAPPMAGASVARAATPPSDTHPVTTPPRRHALTPAVARPAGTSTASPNVPAATATGSVGYGYLE